MAVPKKKTSRARRKRRQAQQKLSSVTLTRCLQCQAPVRPHHACPECGYYKGKLVIREASK